MLKANSLMYSRATARHITAVWNHRRNHSNTPSACTGDAVTLLLVASLMNLNRTCSIDLSQARQCGLTLSVSHTTDADVIKLLQAPRNCQFSGACTRPQNFCSHCLQRWGFGCAASLTSHLHSNVSCSF
jgi:hypothetical protein